MQYWYNYSFFFICFRHHFHMNYKVSIFLGLSLAIIPRQKPIQTHLLLGSHHLFFLRELYFLHRQPIRIWYSMIVQTHWQVEQVVLTKFLLVAYTKCLTGGGAILACWYVNFRVFDAFFCIFKNFDSIQNLLLAAFFIEL